MSRIKSFSVGNGDMFYINHGNDNFTIIDCRLSGEKRDDILNEIARLVAKNGTTRFISTHPDEDHIHGLIDLDKRIDILNFYCVKNEVTKPDESDDFKRYRFLRESEKKAFYLSTGCKRRWLNQSDENRGASGIDILWPDTTNSYFKEALQRAKAGESPNNISPIIKYSLQDGPTVLWMGDLETEFMAAIEDDLDLPKVDILFAPHHGRHTGKIPESMLKIMNPEVIIIGEAPSQHLNYYQHYNTITQNSAGDIVFDCEKGKVHIFTSKEYRVGFLRYESVAVPPPNVGHGGLLSRTFRNPEYQAVPPPNVGHGGLLSRAFRNPEYQAVPPPNIGHGGLLSRAFRNPEYQAVPPPNVGHGGLLSRALRSTLNQAVPPPNIGRGGVLLGIISKTARRRGLQGFCYLGTLDL